MSEKTSSVVKMASSILVGEVFVYGSLMAEEVLIRLLGRVPNSCKAVVKDFHRYSLSNRLYPAVCPKPGGEVVGQVLFGLSKKDMEILDEFEDVEYIKTLIKAEFLESPKFLENQPESSSILAYMYVWANQYDPKLTGSWDYEKWRSEHLESFLNMAFDE